MRKGVFHVHGDNIVECERIVDYIVSGLPEVALEYDFETPACPRVSLAFSIDHDSYSWVFVC